MDSDYKELFRGQSPEQNMNFIWHETGDNLLAIQLKVLHNIVSCHVMFYYNLI